MRLKWGLENRAHAQEPNGTGLESMDAPARESSVDRRASHRIERIEFTFAAASRTSMPAALSLSPAPRARDRGRDIAGREGAPSASASAQARVRPAGRSVNLPDYGTGIGRASGTYAVLVGGLLEDVEPSGDDVDRRAVVLERLCDHEPDACEAGGRDVDQRGARRRGRAPIDAPVPPPVTTAT